MKKKLVLLLSCLALAFNAMAYTNGDRFTINGITYQVVDAVNNILRAATASNAALDAEGTMVVPATVTDPLDPNITMYVTSIEMSANPGKTPPGNLKKLVVSEGITSVTCYSGSLREIYLPKSVTYFNPTWQYPSVTNMVVDPENPKYSVRDNALISNNTTLEMVFHTAVDASGYYSIPTYITTVGASALTQCSNLVHLNIPANVTRINITTPCQFSSKIKEFTVDESNQLIKVMDGALVQRGSTSATTYTMLAYPRANEPEGGFFKVPDGVTSLSYAAIYNPNITKLDLNQVTKLSSNAISSMGPDATLIIPATLTNVPDGSIVADISNYEVEEGNTLFSSEDGILFNADKTKLIKFVPSMTGSYTVPSTVKSIATEAFRYSKLTSLVLDAALTSVGSQCFYASTLTSIDFSNVTGAVTFTGAPFRSCTSLTSVTLPKNIASIPGDMLYGSQVKIIRIPDGATISSITAGAFNSTNIQSFIFEGSCNLQSIASSMFSMCSYLSNITLPAGLKTIEASAFRSCKSLVSMEIPATVTAIGDGAFNGCTNLKTITFASNAQIQTIGRGAFADCGVENFTIPSSVTTIEAEAFKNSSSLSSVTIPASVTSISPEAFKFCSNLTEILVDPANPNFTSVGGVLLSKDQKELLIFPPGMADPGLTLLPPSVEKIADYAFYTNPNLTNVTLPQNVTTIGARAFGLCENLESITLLSNTMLDPAGISQAENKTAFDDGALGNITLNVRAAAKDAYEANTFWKQSTDANPITTSTKVGDNEYIATADAAVMLLGTTVSKSTYEMPSSVSFGGKTYSVTSLGDYAFDGVTGMNEVIIPAGVTYVGIGAFKNSSVSSVYLMGDAFQLGSAKWGLSGDEYAEFSAGQKIYAKRSQVATLKSNMPAFASQVTYEIPLASQASDLGTFCREFATDFSNGGSNTAASPKYLAFTSGTGEMKDGVFVITMHSINEGGAGDGTFIPANTGVIFKKYGTQPSYYEIAETQGAPAVSGIVKPILTDGFVIPATSGTTGRFYIDSSDSKAYRITSPMTGVKYKSYLELAVPSGAKGIRLSFSSLLDDATGISNAEATANAAKTIFNLNGQRMAKAGKGIYIINGKKQVVK